ncbi:Uncharacterised protein [Mycobacteroides abscessus subsp. abscessus]|nr:Uncharacterised protein [Mycobacteroides abscessus subsp. abscessus]SLC82008.1 Uncharacterised protein [Mycobacteroides abscessus subsp. abscessus]
MSVGGRILAIMVPDGGQRRGISLAGLRFHKILASVEEELRTALTRARRESDHSLTIGEEVEAAVRDTLSKYLPSGFGAGEGHVYDAYGDGSSQTDVVITNPEHPLSFPKGRSGTYVVDGVSAAGEVKASLDVGALDDCIKKGVAFKKLRMTVNPSDHVMTVKEQAYMKQIGLVPPYFVVAFENKIADNTIGERLQNAGLVSPPVGKSRGADDMADTPQPPLDAMCLLGRGIWLYIRPDNPMGIHFGVEDVDGPKSRDDLSGWAFLETEAPLAWTLAWLNASMPRMLRGGSVFTPYLIPPRRHAEYMAACDNDTQPRAGQ